MSKSKSRKFGDDELREEEGRKGKSRSRHGRSGGNRSNGGSRNTNGRNSRRTDDMDTKDRSKTVSLGKANDVTWYTRSPEQVNNVANISFLDALGKPEDIYPRGSEYGQYLNNGAPGVLRIGYIPTFGSPTNPSDAMNVALNKTYAELRYVNSGSRNYEAPDYMKYLAVMDSAYAYAGYLTRAYGLINSYSSVNRYWPKAFYKAMRIDYDDVHNNIAAFRTYINNYISKVNSLAVPSTLPIFDRHYWMCANVYLDGDSPWAQAYMQVPEVYAKYNVTTGDVNFYTLHDPGNLATFADLCDIGDDIIDSIMASQDFYIMSGDTIKAFGNSLFQIAGIAEDFVLYPVYDAGVLNQLMNSFAPGYILNYNEDDGSHEPTARKQYVYGLMEDTTNRAIVLGYRNDGAVEPGLLFGSPMTDVTSDAGTIRQLEKSFREMKRMINVTVDEVSPLHVIESTRDAAITSLDYDAWTSATGATTHGLIHSLIACGADVFTTFQIIVSYGTGNVVTYDEEPKFCSVSILDNTPDSNFFYLEFLSHLSSFDWHPIIYSALLKGNSTQMAKDTLLPPFVDVYRAAVVTPDVLTRIHEVANLSLFDVTLKNSFKH